MADLLVTPTTLETLAKSQTDNAKNAQDAAGAMSGLGSDCWVSHGVISGCSNGAFDTIEGIRQAAGSALSDAGLGLAAKLLAAKKAYEGVDGELAGGLSKQMLDK